MRASPRLGMAWPLHRSACLQPELLQAYYDSLASARKLPVRDGEVTFQLEVSVSP
jgi:hypothetical protein